MGQDYLVIGAGIGGLVTGALLAHSGSHVRIVEQHSVPGGYGHSFRRRGYTFCAEIHYIWNCGSNEDGGKIFDYLGLSEDVRFTSLDCGCVDRVIFPEFSFDIAKGVEANLSALDARYPGNRASLRKYYRVVERLHDELKLLPFDFSVRSVLTPSGYQLKSNRS